MKTNNENNKHVQLFAELLEWEANPETLRSRLTDLYFNYTQLVIKAGHEDNGLLIEAAEQLPYLAEIIKVCDCNTVYPQYPSAASDNLTAHVNENLKKQQKL